MFKLYSYFRSSASYRVRCALHWKQIPFETIPVHLLKDGGQQRREEYLRINPMAHVPALDHDGFLVAESVAIVHYLDAAVPQRPLFPADPKSHARVLQICEIFNSGIQPLQNLKVQQYLEGHLGVSKTESDAWARHWIEQGLTAVEKVLADCAGSHAFGGQITAADCFLIPQCFSSRRFGVKIEDFPILARVEREALKLAPFQAAHPERQPDYYQG